MLCSGSIEPGFSMGSDFEHPRLLILQGELKRLKKRIKDEAKRQK